MSQVRTSSFAGTIARPAPVERETVDVEGVWSAVQMALEEPVQTTPKVDRCSQRLFKGRDRLELELHGGLLRAGRTYR